MNLDALFNVYRMPPYTVISLILVLFKNVQNPELHFCMKHTIKINVIILNNDITINLQFFAFSTKLFSCFFFCNCVLPLYIECKTTLLHIKLLTLVTIYLSTYITCCSKAASGYQMFREKKMILIEKNQKILLMLKYIYCSKITFDI